MENSKREHLHVQDVKFRFQSNVLAPVKTVRGMGKPRFSVEPMVYVTGMGWDNVDVFNVGNELVISFYKYVQLKEFMGYEHLGLSSSEIKEKLLLMGYTIET